MQKPAELSVFRGKGARSGGARLQKQKSLTNLTLLSEGEKKRYSCRENWFGSASKSSQVHLERKAELGSRGTLSKALSKSAHSLYHHGSNKSLWETEEPPAVGSIKNSSTRLRAHPSEDSGQGERRKLGVGNVLFKSNFTSQNWVEEEEGCLREGTAQLDEDVIITMLGDLEQALYSDPLGEFTSVWPKTEFPNHKHICMPCHLLMVMSGDTIGFVFTVAKWGLCIALPFFFDAEIV